ncbi:MAG: DUF4440 domain-containing protein [Pseudomonadota bacterium]
MAIPIKQFKKIEQLELGLADPSARKNIARIIDLISDEFEEFSSSGTVIRKQDVLAWLKTPDPVQYELSDFKFKELSEDCILVTYTSLISGKKAFRSSIWVNENASWKMLHHQATTVLPNGS